LFLLKDQYIVHLLCNYTHLLNSTQSLLDSYSRQYNILADYLVQPVHWCIDPEAQLYSFQYWQVLAVDLKLVELNQQPLHLWVSSKDRRRWCGPDTELCKLSLAAGLQQRM
jgi:hypothetical protein